MNMAIRHEEDRAAQAETWRERLSAYQQDGYPQVKGWLNQGMFPCLEVIQQIHEAFSIGGSVAEIGVHHGRFFLAMNSLRRPDEQAHAIDVFDDQALNIDGSGNGSYEKFSRNVIRYGGAFADVTIHTCDSIEIDHGFIQQHFRHQRPRLFSVDGCHTAVHTVNDMQIAQDSLCNGGVIFLDDYYNASWPGVHEGFARFMLQSTPRILPFAMSANKLMLTTIGYHERIYTRFGEMIAGKNPGKLASVEMYGAKVWLVRFPAGA